MTITMADFDLPDTMKLHTSRRPVVGSSEFRSAMASIGSSVSVVTSQRGDERVGRTVTAFLSLSATPPTILVSIDITSRLADFIAKRGSYSVAILADDQQEIANAFAGRVPAEERFNVGDWATWPSGNPMLLGATTAIDCDVIGSMETGTHVLFAGAIVEAETTTSRLPLIWQRHAYHGVSSLD